MRVLELTAPSGVGKSSFLAKKLVPGLESANAKVAVLNRWNALSISDPDAAYAKAVADAIDATPSFQSRKVDPSKLVDELASTVGGELVIMFDQMDELFRHQPGGAKALMSGIARAARLYPFHHVLVTRSEFKSEFKELEKQVPVEHWRWVDLPVLDEPAIREVIEQPAKRAVVPFVWDKEAVGAIEERLRLAMDSGPQIGVLHLQALLWVTWWRLEPGKAVRLQHLLDIWPAFPTALDSEDAAKRSVELFQGALVDYVGRKLGSPDTAVDAAGRAEILTAGRIGPNLSSVDFKIIRDSVDLAHQSLAELGGLGLFEEDPSDPARGQGFLTRAVRTAGELKLADSSLTIEQQPRIAGELLFKQLKKSWKQIEAGGGSWTFGGDHDQAAGEFKADWDSLARSERVARAACETVARFENALRRLEDENIIRRTDTGENHRVVALVHDGFGRALDTWSANLRGHWASALESPTTINTQQLFKTELLLYRDVKSQVSPELIGGPLISNANWVSCYVKADFRDVVFRDCDLSSTLFRDCTFERVTFENCKTWGVLFLDCQLHDVVVQATVDRRATGLKTLVFNHCTLGGEYGVRVLAGGYGLFFDGCLGPRYVDEARIDQRIDLEV